MWKYLIAQSMHQINFSFDKNLHIKLWFYASWFTGLEIIFEQDESVRI